MTPNEYQRLALRTLCSQTDARNRLHAGGPALTQVNHALVGLAGELGELCGVWQKLVYYGHPMPFDELRQRVKDEGGDALWYLAELFDAVGLDLEQVMAGNVAKLRARYPERYTDAQAADEARDRAAEAAAVRSAGVPRPLPGQWDHPETVPGDRSGG